MREGILTMHHISGGPYPGRVEIPLGLEALDSVRADSAPGLATA